MEQYSSVTVIISDDVRESDRKKLDRFLTRLQKTYKFTRRPQPVIERVAKQVRHSSAELEALLKQPGTGDSPLVVLVDSSFWPKHTDMQSVLERAARYGAKILCVKVGLNDLLPDEEARLQRLTKTPVRVIHVDTRNPLKLFP